MQGLRVLAGVGTSYRGWPVLLERMARLVKEVSMHFGTLGVWDLAFQQGGPK